tara:strand:- start:1063 stop:1818 length:756 start_codon:yes stop_codon:yes gene_type:complete
MLGSKSSSGRLSSPRWPGGARIETTPDNYPQTFVATRPIDSTSVNGVVLSGPDWATTNAAQIMQRSRVEIAATAEERIAQALESQEITNDNLEETLRFEMTLGTVPVVKSPKNTTKNMNAYRGPEKWTNGSRDWEPPHDRSDVEPLMLETGKLTKPGLYSARRTSPRWEGGNRLDRDHGSTEYAPDFTDTNLTTPGLNSERRTSPRWDGGNRLDRSRGEEPVDRPPQKPTIFTESNSKQMGSVMKPPQQWQ